eukprot:CAMPEP_0204320024 /NCGR_PEP_ID=MMETSP0469-20131031/7423_1 /ASSEMBLY_ACC=CAM_ASM_000384 /TAXON_ID=2969 /ORGANISM="Oxyrrhis marina" /LENGTH=168 /DNA_ID=CAMNT_0051301267 /DNA_START=160 /DNA_END=667 /DNA_ORIENTATION=+
MTLSHHLKLLNGLQGISRGAHVLVFLARLDLVTGVRAPVVAECAERDSHLNEIVASRHSERRLEAPAAPRDSATTAARVLGDTVPAAIASLNPVYSGVVERTVITTEPETVAEASGNVSSHFTATKPGAFKDGTSFTSPSITPYLPWSLTVQVPVDWPPITGSFNSMK